MDKLLAGIRRFHNKVYPSCRARFVELASGQQPSTLFITCSDSRIVPHMLTQSEPGELFVLRNAGNLVPPYGAEHSGEAATIEYAVKALEVQEIVVCGHSHCGAITGVLRPELVQDLPSVERWLVHAERVRQEILDERLPADAEDDALTTAIKANVLVQLDHLRTYPVIQEAESGGRLAVYGVFYRFETGEASLYDRDAGRFISVLQRAESEPSAA